MESLKIWLLTVVATIAYGIAQDQVTARVAIEYFTIGHAAIFPTESPTLIAIGWGIWATWWVGAIMGLLFALVARFGSRPKMAVRDLLKPGGLLIGCVAYAALLFGMLGFAAAELGFVSLSRYLAASVPADGHSRFIADAWAHTAAYGVGFVGGCLFAGWIWLRRGKVTLPTLTPVPSPAPPASA